MAHELLSSCDMGAPERVGLVVVVLRLSWPMACGILLPQVGIEPVSPALEGGFFSAVQPLQHWEVPGISPFEYPAHSGIT